MKSKWDELIIKAFETLQKENKHETTIKELCSRFDLPYISVHNKLGEKGKLYHIPKQYNVKIVKGYTKDKNDELFDFTTPPPPFENDIQDEEPLWSATTENGKKYICYLKDMIWRAATGKVIPEGMRVVWKDGKPHSLGDSMCCIDNLKLEIIK